MAKGTQKRLTRAQLKRFQGLLELKANDIRESLRSAAATKALARGEEPLDIEELPGQSHEEWIFLNRNQLDVMLLRQIEEALARIEDGDYGTCMECEESISLKRLQAVPWAHYCVSCQEQLSAYQGEAPQRARQSSRRN